MAEAQVICASTAYFTSEDVKDAAGKVRKDKKGDPLSVDVRRSARMGDVIEVSDHEFARLESLGAVRKPSNEPLRPEQTVPTPFGTPIVDAEGERRDAPTVPQRTGLTPEELAEFERRAAGEGEDEGEGEAVEFDVAEATPDEIAEHINEQNLNADATVALAGEGEEADPELAAKVFEAEEIAKGDNARKSVLEPLAELIEE